MPFPITLSDTASITSVWLLGTWDAANGAVATLKFKCFKFCFVFQLIKRNLKCYMWLVATVIHHRSIKTSGPALRTQCQPINTAFLCTLSTSPEFCFCCCNKNILKEVIQLTVPGYSLSQWEVKAGPWSNWLHLQSRADNECVSASLVRLPLYTYTIQEQAQGMVPPIVGRTKLREWCRPQWTGLSPQFIQLRQFPKGMPTGQPNLHSPSSRIIPGGSILYHSGD